MAVTATYTKVYRGSWKVNAIAASNVKFIFGTFSPGTYAGGGVTWTFPQFTRTEFVQVGMASGYSLEYDYSNQKLMVMYLTGGVEGGVEIASDTSLASWSALRFMAWGTGKA